LINYDSPKELRSFLSGQGLGMRKKFGQNFLINPAARLKLLDALEIKSDDRIWEIGSGLGAMTAGLLERGADITAFEIDPAFCRLLRDLFGASPSFRLVEGDVLKTWPTVHQELIGNDLLQRPESSKECPEIKLMGNLPYNIAAILLADFIEKRRFFNRIVVTVQREVARRMAAGPGTKEYSSFSVLCSSVYKVSLLSIIKSSSFYPAPNVDSQGVCMDILGDRERLPDLFNPLVRSLFSGRRKTIRNTLTAFTASAIIKGGKNARDIANDVLERSGLSGDRRPETLGIEEFARLAALLEDYF